MTGKCATARWGVKSQTGWGMWEMLYGVLDGRRNEEMREVVWRDGLGPGRVWPEVNVFLETVSQISDWSCVICHWLERWQQKKRCPRCDNSAVRNESSSQQLSLSPYSPPLRLVRFGPFTSQSWEREREKKAKTAQRLSFWTDSSLSLALFLAVSQDSCVEVYGCNGHNSPLSPVFIKTRLFFAAFCWHRLDT